MKGFTRTFLTGLAAILPIAITVALFWWLGSTAESLLGGLLQYLLPDVLYFPGLGLIIAIALIFGIGVLLRAYVVQGLFAWLEDWMQRIPVIKTIYGIVRDVMNVVSGDIQKQFGAAVLVSFPGTDYRLVGFVTREDFEGLPENLGSGGRIAVYLPMSYQIGGYTIMLPRDQVEPLDLSLEDAMRYTLTAGVSARRNGA
ncbi:protein of unknown function DUF502 [Thioalkalivibrio nitratireducens DSM 14787]|uniref:Transporter n=1 Tax=Thioalkalivibrio nitratireducens (strain DSM 14787 / UNIQEM 213 / ALEN2) TaxID=1255043 RepID=L0DRE8_THIND|nr:DUF502 domain-containing protein [Thioalkalivibrio nitratireducens]AGA32164.1 protein of unknown function DUF502 [Thioalkalivibrio nitratireducens DSM 14787]